MLRPDGRPLGPRVAGSLWGWTAAWERGPWTFICNPIAATMTRVAVNAAADLAVELRNVSKTFPGGKAVDDVSFGVARGSIHALLGGNGSGKSTLVKSLAGVQSADPGGTVVVDGSEIATQHLTPIWARHHGLRFVHQNPGIFPDMTVAENIAMGHGLPGQLGRLKRRTLQQTCRELLERFQIEVSPTAKMGDLRLADQTMVAIARALQVDHAAGERITAVVLDEPTAALPEEEVEILLAAVRRAAQFGAAIIYVSHRLEEVLSIANAVTVLRDGLEVVTRSAEGLTERELISLIVGKPLGEVFPATTDPTRDRPVVAEFRCVTAAPLRQVDLQLREGEILGIAGLLGSGRTELLRVLFGSHPVTSGEVLLAGKAVRIASPAAAMSHGVAYVPEDRDSDASFMGLTVRQNISAATMPEFSRYGRLRHKLEHRGARESIAAFRVRTFGDGALMSSLSGGNRQKVILARWMRNHPKILLLDEPTQGVDVGARADAYQLIRQAVDSGAAAILVSSDFEELADMSDRVLVLQNGEITAEVHREQLNRQYLTELVFMAKTEASK
jgi:ribose transport system ATP-binding protein